MGRKIMLGLLAGLTLLGAVGCHQSQPAQSGVSQSSTEPGTRSVNQVQARIGGGEVFPAAHQMIKGARQTVHLEMYEFGNHEVDGKPGATKAPGYAEQQQLVQDLVDDAARGVKVKVLLDASREPSGETNNQKMVEYLQSHGVEVAVYPADTVNIDHVKLLVVDGQQVLIGGMNWSNRSPANHDADVLIQGPAARDADKIFDADWKFAHGDTGALAPQTPGGDIHFMTTSPHEQNGGTSEIRNEILDNIKSAKKSIYVELYALNNKAIIQALIEARERGVDVRVIVDPSERRVNEKAADELNASGVPTRWFAPEGRQLLHAKWSVMDSQTTDIGSSNWTTQALDGAGQRSDGSRPSKAKRNHEASVHLHDGPVASRFQQQFLEDWDHRTQ